MPHEIRAITPLLLTCMLLGSGCSDEPTGDNWPTYEVRGTVRTGAGAAVAGALVELAAYGQAGCGGEPSTTSSSVLTDAQGRYSAKQDLVLTNVLDGCLQLIAHPDSSRLSQPTAVADVPVDSVVVVDGETVFTVDLTLP